MSQREYRYSWEWDLGASPAQLWPLVADTNRFDRDGGVPVATDLDALGGGPRPANGRAHVRVKQYGIPLDYVQEPFEWDEPHRFSVTRTFETGPLASLRIEADLSETAAGGTHLTYTVVATPRHPVLGPAIPIQVGVILARRFDKAFRQYDRIAQLGDLTATIGPAPRLARGAGVRLEQQRGRLIEAGVDPDLAALVVGHVRDADELAVARMRPYVLADQWQVARRPVIEAFLVATRSGLVELRWDVLCPMCRGAKAVTSHLATLPPRVHCDTCLVDYDADFATSVELTFTPSPTIRTVSSGEYCIGNPMQTPHVVRQRLLAPGETIEVPPPPSAGRYRVRSLGHPGSTYLRVTPDGHRDLHLRLGPGGWPAGEPEIHPDGRLVVWNDLDEERLMILERTALGDQAVTAAEVTAMQRFRDLFAQEVLRPSEQVSVGTLTVVFTDLCDSTRMYQQIGDAVAFGRVLDHFDILTRAVADEGGAVVKTIGDAVMAVFPRPLPAVRAVLRAQRELAAAAASYDPTLTLKIGVHAGPCIAVNLNDRLDYFGSTVNLAARLQGRAGPDEIVVSHEVFTDPEVQDLVAVSGDDLRIEHGRAELKGFAAEVSLVRLRAGAPTSPAAPDVIAGSVPAPLGS